MTSKNDCKMNRPENGRIRLIALKYTIDYKNANEILTKTLKNSRKFKKFLHRNNTSKNFFAA